MKLNKISLWLIASITLITFIFISCILSFNAGKSKGKYIAVDFSIEDVVEDSEHKYSFLNKSLSDYICNLSAELGIDSDLVVSILMVENPEFNPDVMHKNINGTIDCGLFQLNDRYLWTTFKNSYWVDNVELDPFNWKHNCFIAMHHLAYLQEKLKVNDEVVMAYNCGIGAVMNGDVPASTKVYLCKVKNNMVLLKGNAE